MNNKILNPSVAGERIDTYLVTELDITRNFAQKIITHHNIKETKAKYQQFAQDFLNFFSHAMQKIC